jgi:hypothetical protein
MDSMADAMKRALENPLEAPPHRPRLVRIPKAVDRRQANFLWMMLAGSAASLSLATMLLFSGARDAG